MLCSLLLLNDDDRDRLKYPYEEKPARVSQKSSLRAYKIGDISVDTHTYLFHLLQIISFILHSINLAHLLVSKFLCHPPYIKCTLCYRPQEPYIFHFLYTLYRIFPKLSFYNPFYLMNKLPIRKFRSLANSDGPTIRIRQWSPALMSIYYCQGSVAD